jgi:anion-transporting  ArsA/GET3 family ATPase
VKIDEFLAPRILIVSGKGGVGKTTVAAALALVAARHGRRVCVAEVDRKGALGGLLGGKDLSYEPAELTPGVWGMNIVPEQSLAEYLDVQYHMKRISRVFTSTHFVDYITTAAPGLKDILVLGKVWYLEHGRGTDGRFDTIVMDAPAAGHMLTFLSAPLGLSDAVRVGPVRRQAEWLMQMLRDPERTRVHLVTLPEEMPVSETLETAEALRAKVGIPTGAVFANGLYAPLFDKGERKLFEDYAADGMLDEILPEAQRVGLTLDGEDHGALLGYARFLEARRAIQAKHLRALKRGLEEPVTELPFLFSAGLALPDIETLADVIEEKVARL